VPESISPIGGLILGLFGGIIIIVAALLAFLVGDSTTGAIGIVFFLLIIIFAIMGYIVKEHEMKLVANLALMLIGFIIMILAPILINPLEFVVIVMAIFGGLLAVLAAVLLFPRKPRT
jgi:predicted membrane channel-forming protein YqfA (hemolysin III family)